ncbi:hypothetical protein DICPUDRAFT_148794 [Dictyostelium purpureum]|uniref:Uncharacterized protein n=1 Tax=Dictyostelium purpureum TaxID=5786 RepID=F0ZC07_DICPU|nr:uncharacterized protein DICPUDRAFT_148794 [Dictyostelium purpureum]EGC38511.1 hypothetical protein DICPUDRAFT_148794 [Dictyostelium purpureum]|eukprot:XP_003284976.1 hypothetical protein DICPUDRAFT_148794 [Dictyostelium purpureum]
MIRKLFINNLFSNSAHFKNIRLFSTANSTIPQSLLEKNNQSNNNILKTNNKIFDIDYVLNQYKANNNTDIEKNIIEYYQSFVDDFAKKETKLMNWDISHWAALKGHTEILKNFIDFKQQQQQQKQDQQSSNSNENNKKFLIKQDKFGVNSLHIAIQRGNYDLAMYLIETGECDLNQRDTKPGIRLSALHLAMNHSNPSYELIKKLLEGGANVNQETTERRTVLFRASQLGRLDLVELFLKFNANINIQDNPKTNGWEYYRVSTPLHISVSKGDFNIVKSLIENGGNPNLRLMDDCGESLLHVAALNGDIEMTKYLVEKGGDLNQLDCYEATPLDYAESGYQSNIQYIKFLKDNYNVKNGKGRKM